jgi:flagellar basal body-associated protein FliL
MIPDLLPSKRLTAILILLAIPVVLAAIMILSVYLYKKTIQLPRDSEQIKKVSDLIKVADSIRDSSLDSVLVYYNKSILLLQTSSREKDNLHHLSKAYYGLAYINSTNGDYKADLQNDSIAMVLALQAGERKLIAKTL